ncbi:MAG: preprotein translocase subunit SecG [Candidatus Lambdaproteobacteria bacterium]|nr:preprotein translocase subunit SecG [Candidatus Lambdaproteobacteria bacterium]
MFIALLILHVLVAIGLVFVVLLQSGRGAELGAAFGGVGQATFGRSQSTFITKFTTGMAVVFMATSLALAFLTVEHPSTSVVTGGAEPARTEEPAPQGAPPAPTGPGAATAPGAPVQQAAAPAAPGTPAPQAAAPDAPSLPQTDAPPQSDSRK